jgi:hypothetical protein
VNEIFDRKFEKAQVSFIELAYQIRRLKKLAEDQEKAVEIVTTITEEIRHIDRALALAYRLLEKKQ